MTSLCVAPYSRHWEVLNAMVNSQETSVGSTLDIVVMYSGDRSTLDTLGSAAELSKGLNARIRLVCVECVPYASPIDSPAVSVPFRLSKLQSLATVATLDSTQLRIDLYVCRDARQALESIAGPKSLVMLGRSARWLPAWWPSRENRMARWLRAMGCPVLRP
jgi:hypothetical protein